jgi:hypothetical protein
MKLPPGGGHSYDEMPGQRLVASTPFTLDTLDGGRPHQAVIELLAFDSA